MSLTSSANMYTPLFFPKIEKVYLKKDYFRNNATVTAIFLRATLTPHASSFQASSGYHVTSSRDCHNALI